MRVSVDVYACGFMVTTYKPEKKNKRVEHNILSEESAKNHHFVSLMGGRERSITHMETRTQKVCACGS